MSKKLNIEQQLDALGQAVGRTDSIEHSVMARIQTVPAPAVSPTNRIWRLIMEKPLLKWLPPAVAAALIIIVLNLTPSGNQGLVWADVMEKWNLNRIIKFNGEIIRPNGDRETAEYWLDTQDLLMIGQASQGIKVSLDLKKQEQRVYLPDAGNIQTMPMDEEMVKALVPEGKFDLMRWWLNLIGQQFGSDAQSLSNWEKTSQNEKDTVFALTIDAVNQVKLHMVMTVDNKTEQPVKLSLKQEDPNGDIALTMSFDYPDSMPRSLEEMGIKPTQTPEAKKPVIEAGKPLLQGQLLDPNNQPVAGKIIGVGYPEETAPDGTFSFVDDGDMERMGRLNVYACNQDRTLGKAFVWSMEHSQLTGPIVLEPTITIIGRIVGTDGKPIPQAKVEVFPASGRPTGADYPCDYLYFSDQARFEIRFVPLGLDIKLYVESPGFEGIEIDIHYPKPGQVWDAGAIVLEYGKGFNANTQWNRTLTGRIINEKGQPFLNAEVRIDNVTGQSYDVQTNWKGEFKIEGLPQNIPLTIWLYSTQGYGGNTFRICAPDTKLNGGHYSYRAENVPADGPLAVWLPEEYQGHQYITITPKSADYLDIQLFPRGWELYGKPAPELLVESWLNSEPQTLASLKGKVVLLVFGLNSEYAYSFNDWTKWAGSLKDQYADKGLVVLGFHQYIKSEQVESLRQAIRQKTAITFPVALESEQSLQDVYDDRGSGGFYLIDREGILRCSPTDITARVEIEKLIDR